MATRATKGGASASPTFERGDWLGLGLFLAPIGIAALHWLAGGL